MKKNRSLKGFTLLELIIVMAIFGLLLTGVMTLIDPVSKTMRNTAVRENNAASVNNVKEYLENSLRYSEYIAVYNGGYSVENTAIAGGRLAMSRADRKKVVEEFVTDYYKNRVDSNGDPITGVVRVLEIDNSTGGIISEMTYDFISPQTYKDSAGNEMSMALSGDMVKEKEALHQAINDTYYQHYSYFIKAGYNQTQPLSSAVASSAPFNLTLSEDGRFYYSKLYEVKDDTGANPLYDFGPAMFSLSIVTYENDGAFMGSFDIADDTSTAYDETDRVQVFRSPIYLANSTMALPNINSTTVADKVYGVERDITGATVTDGTTGNPVFYELNSTNGHLLQPKVALYDAPAGTNAGEEDNIYFIYTLPRDVAR